MWKLHTIQLCFTQILQQQYAYVLSLCMAFRVPVSEALQDPQKEAQAVLTISAITLAQNEAYQVFFTNIFPIIIMLP